MPTGHQDFDLIPSFRRTVAVDVVAHDGGAVPKGAAEPVTAVLVDAASLGQTDLGLGAQQVRSLGFDAEPGQVLVLPGAADGGVRVATGVAAGPLSAAALRDAAAAASAAVPTRDSLALALPPTDLGVAEAVLAAVEGALLARYTFTLKHRTKPSRVPLTRLVLAVDPADVAAAEEALPAALAVVRATELGRDFANAPGGQLTATRLGELALEVGTAAGLEVEVFEQDALVEMGLGGLLAVNLGSTEPARMIKVTYIPDDALGAPAGRLALVGKGIMYDSGGISLKPSDGTHATMKNDMSGAGSILAAMTALPALGCRAQVTGYLMCTDNMPSGSALKLGDVITVRGGTTVEIINTDAEGRLVMSDALVLATEDDADAIVDLATLTGATLRALGPDVAGVMGNDQALVDQVRTSADRVDEPVWQFPLIESYRPWLDSPIADLVNLGGVHAGQITAALFLREFVGETPWAHVDIAGTSQRDSAKGWRCQGATGFGTRLLIDLAASFVVA